MPLEQILSKIDIYYIEIAREPLEIIVMTDVVVDGRFDKRQLTTDIKSHFTFLRHKGILHFGKFLMDLTENLILRIKFIVVFDSSELLCLISFSSCSDFSVAISKSFSSASRLFFSRS